MQLIKPSVQILSVTPTPLQLIELAGRTCYKSENRISPMSAETFVRSLIRRGHESVLEHASATLRFICDRGVSHELVRHRLASYSQANYLLLFTLTLVLLALFTATCHIITSIILK